MRTTILAGLTALLISAATTSDAKDHIILAPYPAAKPWRQVTNQADGLQWLREQIPADQDLATYKDILAAQSFPGAANLSPAAFLQGMFSQTSGACEAVRISGPKAQLEGGYEVAYGQLFCSRQKGQPFGVVMFAKVIKGDESIYLINREFRVPPSDTAGVQTFSKDQMAQMQSLMKAESAADQYLVKSVYICATRSTDPRCAKR